MGIEIEYKFLVINDAWKSQATKSTVMKQGYLNDLRMVEGGQMKSSVRVRIEGDLAFLNIKSAERGATRQEFEYPVPMTDAEALLALCVGGLIEKTRYIVPHANREWEVDVFEGTNAGLIVAEIEVESEDAVIAKPDWTGADVTDAIRYYNLSLADYPYSAWTEQEKTVC